VTPGILRIPYESESFPAGTLSKESGELDVTWGELLWAAVTVGRPNRQFVFRAGDSFRYEALFRWSLVRTALEQNPGGFRLRRTEAARTLDPTEKGAINYFLGMTLCKLFAAKLLNTPWLLHLDVFRPQINAVLTGRSRPDLVGMESGTGRWHAFECKGRISPPSERAKASAKAQAVRLVSVNATPCTLHVGAITYLRSDVLHFYWRDPEPERGTPIKVPLRPDAWRYYYSPVLRAVLHARDEAVRAHRPDGRVALETLDLEVGIHRSVEPFLLAEKWDDARRAAEEHARELAMDGYQADGLLVVAGASWRERFQEFTGDEG
jgi:hypothetical protein